jgi:hypothetical protein
MPVTLDCVTGFMRSKGAVHQTVGCPVGYAWAGSGCRPASGRVQSKCLPNCGNAYKGGCLHVVLRVLPGRACVGYARGVGLVRVQIADRVWGGADGAYNRSLSRTVMAAAHWRAG